MIDYNYIRMLNDNDTFLVKTSLLTKNYIEPEYFKMSVKDIKIIFAKAPSYIYTNSSFKEISKSK